MSELGRNKQVVRAGDGVDAVVALAGGFAF